MCILDFLGNVCAGVVVFSLQMHAICNPLDAIALHIAYLRKSEAFLAPRRGSKKDAPTGAGV
jgi:hypothetical protein